MLTTVSSESLTSAAEFHRATSPASADLAATTVPNPKTRSLIPIVLMSNTEAPVGASLPDKRIGASGATTNATPTKARSHPIASLLAIRTAAAYLKQPARIHRVVFARGTRTPAEGRVSVGGRAPIQAVGELLLVRPSSLHVVPHCSIRESDRATATTLRPGQESFNGVTPNTEREAVTRPWHNGTIGLVGRPVPVGLITWWPLAASGKPERSQFS
jgi:hypothetical protein